MPVRAAELALQASRSYFAADAVAQALPLARQGLLALIRAGHTRRVPALLSKATTALRSKGHDAEADQLEEEVTRALEEQGLSLADMQQAPAATGKRGSLPAQCGGCGAPLAPGDVEWHDDHTAECPYCGTLAKAT
jgi:hypothetical protein